LTLRREPLAGLREVEVEMEAGRAPRSPAALVASLAARLQARIDDAVNDLEDRMDALEAAALESELDGEQISELADIRRDSVSIRRHLAPQGQALADLLKVAAQELGFATEHLLRELADRTRRHVEVLDSIRERAGVTQEEQSHRLAQRLNQRMYALTVVAGIFLPLSFVTGLLGVNVSGIPYSDHPAAFVWISGVMVGVLALEVWIFRKMGWL
nr:CorA family divalent cation transporter [Myxococcota bacterium]